MFGVNPDTLSGGSNSIMAKWQETSDQRAFIIAPYTGGTEFYVSSLGTGASVKATGYYSGGLSTSSWTMLTVVYEASTRLTLYTNGSQLSENTTSIPASLHDSTTDFAVGFCPKFSGAAIYWDGLQQDAIIWTTALTDAEVSDLYDDYTVSAGGSGPASLKTLDTVATASIKTINGVAIASVKTINTIT